ncbi:Scr1 family TA system antitoxin-like transcriptional regulator [Nocardiopsis tropica]|uniref:Scr1 family TA system antitoxin-like transcriptional regulator n=1 Tax=Nocardiopsis tropica TaxID=109330 RepID=A0ABU7KR88_9ACTN|nr:Scr1 family TA system antitoxin-like transcriptional regulator [Nocardiopsis umidischolae]MEE2051808.1 Scr1 family TA system antitoxin-like transcriptional regulator [Nocardiopsis umidischolae]
MTTTETARRALVADLMFSQREAGRHEAGGPVDHWVPAGVPEYMQTEEYAGAVLTAGGPFTDEEAAHAVADRMVRVSILRTVAVQRRILVTRAGIERPILPPAAMSRQRAQLADLARLDHVQLRVLPECVPTWPAGFELLHSVHRVLVEGPMGGYTPPGPPPRVLDAYRHVFVGLWEASDPYPG